MKLIINHTSLLENITKGGDNVMLVEGHPDDNFIDLSST